MSEEGIINKFRWAAFTACILLALGLTAWAVHRYSLARESLAALQQQEDLLRRLNKDIIETKNSIEKFKKEQDEFRKLLFDERDVPAFLDGISDSAAKSLVYVMEMKTQQFREVQIPQKSSDSHKLARARVYEDFDNQKFQDPKNELNEMLTLAAMPINIKVQGTFEAIVNFLNSIEGYRQLLTVSNVEITTGINYPQLTCNFTLRIYSLKKLNDIKP